MTLRDLLAERQAAVCERWLDAILAGYGEVTATRWRREKDPFANPVGHALTAGLPPLLETITRAGEPAADAVAALEAIVRIRSVQELTPARAVGFVSLLRDAVRQELSAELAGGAHAAALAEVDAGIERLLLLAFDAYVRVREQVFRLRQDELKRSVASILRRWNDQAWRHEEAGFPGPPLAPPLAPDLVRLSLPPVPGGRR